jgi:sporulation protein YhbH
MSGFSYHKTTADRSASDRRRHKHKIERAIRDGIYDIVADESIIGQDGKKKFRIPVRGIKEYRFVYGSGEANKNVGSAPGKNLERGQVVRDKKKGQAGNGKPDKPGNKKGEEYYEVEISLDELAKYLFDELELPDMERKSFTKSKSEKLKRTGYRPQGIIPRLDKKKSAINRIKRLKAKQRHGDESDELEGSFHTDDLTYRHYKPKMKENTNAVILMLMDVSGSMGQRKKFLARSFFFLLYQFIRSKYDQTEVVFISHDMEARECSEEQFFTRGSGGGTIVSTAYVEALDVINKRYHPSSWNVYAFHASDGDNFGTDTNDMLAAAEKLKNICQLFGYIEITPEEAPSWYDEHKISNHLKQLIGRSMKCVTVKQKEDIWKAFRIMFGNYGSE